ncbi:MAG: antitoxin [Propionibacteriaceae bacterium]|jgi:hypothetical protein|nr:antitoxin [Propionibacteriaceae bacterium]
MDIVGQVKGVVEAHEDDINKGIDAVGDLVDKVTGGKIADKVDQVQDFLKDKLDTDEK